MLLQNVKRPSGLPVKDLLALVPEELYGQLAKEFKADKWVQKLHASVLFKLIIYSIFHSERLSLRVMETLYEKADFRALSDAVGKTAYTSIRDRLCTVPVKYFAGLYEHFYAAAEAAYGAKQLETKYFVRRFDSTMISTFAHYLEGMRVGNTSKDKVQVKYTVEFRHTFLLRANLHTDQCYLSEERALGEAVQAAELAANEVLVFDRGLQNRAVFAALTQAGKPFVTRLKSKARMDVIEQLALPTSLTEGRFTIKRYAKVYLYGNAKTRSDTPLYLVEGTGENGQPLCFVTNLTPEQASPHVVADLYRQRWDIEVLFRFLKQEK